MNFVCIHTITEDVSTLASFCEHVTGGRAVHLNEHFADVRTPSGTLAIGSAAAVGLFGPGSAKPAENQSVILEFLVDDIDLE